MTTSSRRFNFCPIQSNGFDAKIELLQQIILKYSCYSVIVLVQRKTTASDVCKTLNRLGISATESHRNVSKAQREYALDAFRRGCNRALVMTDKTLTGNEDIQNIHAIQFDAPTKADLIQSCLERHRRLYDDRERVSRISFFLPIQEDIVVLKPLLSTFLRSLNEVMTTNNDKTPS
jgi:superfamily II DNA/RNA helicase